MTLALIDEAVGSGARLQLACELAGVSARTVQRWREQGPDGGEDRRRGPHKAPVNKLSSTERANLLEVVNSEPYRNLSPKQIVPRLADQGIYLASESTVYRVLEEAGQNSHRQPAKPRTHARPQERTATGPCQILCWDITYLPTAVRGQFYFLYLFLDIWSRKIVGWGVHDEQCGQFAADLLEATCDSLDVSPEGIVLHADNGKPMKGSSMLSTMQWLGIVPSFSRPHVSDDNPFVESLFRTLKYRPGFTAQRFTNLDEAVAWVQCFVAWYNHEHLHSAIGFVTPHDRHVGRDVQILAGRRRVYAKAHKRRPERWTGNMRQWRRPVSVRLHPDRDLIPLTPRKDRQSA
jgi:transposase InsO family protein